MKTLRFLIALMLFTGYVSSLSSCTVIFKSDNGKHKGWFKKPHHPHGHKPGRVGNPGNGNKGKKKK